MKIHMLWLVCLVLISGSCSQKENTKAKKSNDILTPFEKGNGNQTATYAEVLNFYKELRKNDKRILIEKIGQTDSGEPLHLISFAHKKINWNKLNDSRLKLLINNGIHPGESDGIDATMMLFRDLSTGKIDLSDDIIISAIAVYNVGGALNRNSTTRTNQNGPEEYGFRGNARNYDLNRDFIKADTRNARAFHTVYHRVNPDIFIDNHVSNGADYKYTLTSLFTQHNKLDGPAGELVYELLEPELNHRLAERNWDIIPYVNVWGSSPDKGYSQFMDYPRYSTGYTSLWNTLGMMVETHMLKPYNDRVYGTLAIMEEMIAICTDHKDQIQQARAANFEHFQSKTHYPTQYKVHKNKADSLSFKGYAAINKTSEVTGNTLLTYDRNQPYVKTIPFYNHYQVTDSIKIPEYYILPQGWWPVEELLRSNNIQFIRIATDTLIEVNSYTISDYNTSSNAYEGHYPHSNVKVLEKQEKIRFRESDIIIPTNQPGIKFIIETLEPTTNDSFFVWNYFDTILQQKEGFSTYVFEQTAKELLENNSELNLEFLKKKETDPTFASSNYAQLKWLHERSPNYEKAHLSYPIYKKYYDE